MESTFHATIIRDARSESVELWKKYQGPRDILDSLLLETERVFVPWGWRKLPPQSTSTKGAKKPRVRQVSRYVDGGVVSAIDAIQAWVLRVRARRRYQLHLNTIPATTQKLPAKLGAVSRGVRASAGSLAFAKAFVVARKIQHKSDAVKALGDMASSKDMQAKFLVSRKEAEAQAKTAAALLLASQLEAAAKERATLEERRAAAAAHAVKHAAHRSSEHAYFMNAITNTFHLPAYPNSPSPSGVAAAQRISTQGLVMNLRLVDYWVLPTGQAVLENQWAVFTNWLRVLGFTVNRDHSAQQMGASCGHVAARVATWLRESGDGFMHLPTNTARDWDHIISANKGMADKPFCRLKSSTHMYEYNLDITEHTEVVAMTDHFNGGRLSELMNYETENNARPFSRDGEPASKFCYVGPFDQLLHDIARDVRTSLDGAPVGKKYHITNNENSNGRGTHWVTVVYEIKSATTSPQHIFHPASIGATSSRLHFDFDAIKENSTSVSSPSAASALAQFFSSSSSSSAASSQVFI